MAPHFSPGEILRYSRQTALRELGEEGQLRLKGSKVLVVGAGALGSPVLSYLAAAGVGKLILADGDVVDSSNLHRQIIHHTSDVGQPKADSAGKKLRDLNPEIEIECHRKRLTPDNAMSLVRDCDLIVDGCDNFPTRFLTCDLGFLANIPVVHGAINRFEGQISVFHPHMGGPCYRCLLPAIPPAGTVPSCQEAGVIGALPGIIGSYMAMETVKMLAGIGAPLIGRLLVLNILTANHRTIQLRKDPACLLCGDSPTIRDLHNQETLSDVSCASSGETVDAGTLRQWIDQQKEMLIVDVRDPWEHAACAIPGSLLLPLGRLTERSKELPRNIHIILHCKSGARSAQALESLQSLGFTRVLHLQGGIDAWNRLESI